MVTDSLQQLTSQPVPAPAPAAAPSAGPQPITHWTQMPMAQNQSFSTTGAQYFLMTQTKAEDDDIMSPFEETRAPREVPGSWRERSVETPPSRNHQNSPLFEHKVGGAKPFTGPGHADPEMFQQFQRFAQHQGMDPRIVHEFQNWMSGNNFGPAPGVGVNINPSNYGRSAPHQWKPASFEICRKQKMTP